MPYPEVLIRSAPPPARGLSSRADVALFVGLVPRRSTPLPDGVRAELEAAGWAGSGALARSPAAVEALLDVPVTLDSFDAFAALFDWEAREVEAGGLQRIPCALGLAVQGFFAAGGQRAIVVRTGDPLPLLPAGAPEAAVAAKRRLLSWPDGDAPADAAARVPLLPGFNGRGTPADATDPRTWHGAAHVLGVEEAAMLSLPDLPELFAGAPSPLPAPPAPPPAPEQWRPCAPPAGDYVPGSRAARPAVAAPRLSRDFYLDWASGIRFALDMLSPVRSVAQRRDVMLLAALPLPAVDPELPVGSEAWPLALLDTRFELPQPPPDPPRRIRLFDREQIGSARLQLAYPWIETEDSLLLPEGVHGAEGALMGAIAATSLRVGAFRSAARAPLAAVRRTVPELATGALRRGLPGGQGDWLGDRLSLVGSGTGGFTLLSDATVSNDRAWRAGGVSRLMGIILRASRTLGQRHMFANSGPALWSSMRDELEVFLTRLRSLGALEGATQDQAFSVRCDRTTMTQADIDAGRVIATIAFTAAQPVQRITVTLALGHAGTAIRAAA